MTAHAKNASAMEQRHATASHPTPRFTRRPFGHGVCNHVGAALDCAQHLAAIARPLEILNRSKLAMTRTIKCADRSDSWAPVVDDRMSSLVAGYSLLGITPESGCLVNLRNPRRWVAGAWSPAGVIPVHGRQPQGVARSGVVLGMARGRVGREDADWLGARVAPAESGDGEDSGCPRLTC
jgi:hypothetical protein